MSANSSSSSLLADYRNSIQQVYRAGVRRFSSSSERLNIGGNISAPTDLRTSRNEQSHHENSSRQGRDARISSVPRLAAVAHTSPSSISKESLASSASRSGKNESEIPETALHSPASEVSSLGTVVPLFRHLTRRPDHAYGESPQTIDATTFDATLPKRPEMVIDEVLNWIPQTKHKMTPLPHNGDAWLNKLNARDQVGLRSCHAHQCTNISQIFLIDDSETMRPHWSNVKRAFEALAYLVKKSDYDGIDLRFTNHVAVERSAKHRKPLIATLNGIQPGGKCDIGLTFGRIIHGIDLENKSQAKKGTLSRHLQRKKKWGTSIYVLTDGMWEEESNWLRGMVDPLRKLIDRDVQNGQVGVQFIQFGNDPDGTARLKTLDEGLNRHGVSKSVTHLVSTDRMLTSTET
jgi:hypothetical protein